MELSPEQARLTITNNQWGVNKMKKTASIITAAALMIALLTPAAALAEDVSVYVSSTGSGSLNLRSGPGKEYSVKGYVFHNSDVSEISTSGEWSKVKVSSTGKTGWIKTKYIDGTTKELGTGKKTVDCSSTLNLRSGPGTNYTVKGKVQDGTTVKVLNTEDDWVKITDYSTGKTGWIMEKYIEVDDGWPDFGSGFFDDDDDAFDSEVGSVYHVTGTNNLNVRSGPGSSNKKLDSLFEGTAFRVTDTSGNWFEIRTFDGVTGWVSKNYTTAGADAVVTASTLNMRSGAGTGYSVKRSLSCGTVVKVNSVNGNWAHITYKGVSGYVSLNYLSF